MAKKKAEEEEERVRRALELKKEQERERELERERQAAAAAERFGVFFVCFPLYSFFLNTTILFIFQKGKNRKGKSTCPSTRT